MFNFIHDGYIVSFTKSLFWLNFHSSFVELFVCSVEFCRSDGPIQSDDKEFLQLAKTFSLCVAFSANIGGVATLTGTPPNIVFKGIADK